MNFTQFLPADRLPALRWLGKINGWLKIRAATPEEEPLIAAQDSCADPNAARDRASCFEVSRRALFAAPGAETYARIVARWLDEYPTGMRLVWLDALAACVAHGLKEFVPTDEQFDAMQHVEARIPVADYRQPYPAVVVRIPTESRRRLAERIGLPVQHCPLLLLLRTGRTDEGSVYVTIGTSAFGDLKENTFFFQERLKFKTVEDALQSRVLKTEETDVRSHAYAEACGRAAVNLMLMLVHYGHRDAPLPAGATAKRRKGERRTSADFRTIEIVQNVTVRRVQYAKNYYGPTGEERPPHWRDGHWRNQVCGPRNSERKLIFINPVMVRADRAVGDLADTSARYEVR